MRPSFAALVAMALMSGGVARAETVYKCQAGGQTIYQQTPCARNQNQQTIRLQDAAPASATQAPAPKTPEATADDTAAGPPAAPAPPPPPPPPQMFGCIRATDGKPYTSANGNPDPYLAPFGVLGAVSAPLGATYGNPNASVASAPELNRGNGNVAAVSTQNYVWVQDRCRPLSPAESCRLLRDDASSNEKRIRNAFKSERGPLEAKDAQLREDLRGCG